MVALFAALAMDTCAQSNTKRRRVLSRHAQAATSATANRPVRKAADVARLRSRW